MGTPAKLRMMVRSAAYTAFVAIALVSVAVAQEDWNHAIAAMLNDAPASQTALVQSSLAGDGKLNVYGKPLQKCSTPGMAMTGFTRDGRCVEQQDDAGSHHICIDLSKLGSEKDFCQVTGQPDWCAQKGGCMEDQAKKCPRKHWCVCQWAFTGYIHTAGGCDKIQNVVCDAVNMEALKAYEKGAAKGVSADGGKVADALACLKQKCPGIGSSS